MSLFNPDDHVQIEDKDYFVELVGEGKKFQTPQDLARGKAEADAFIEQLKSEAAKLREELKSRATIEEFLAKANTKTETQAPVGEVKPNPETTSVLKKEEVTSLFDQLYEEREKANIKRKNLNDVNKYMNDTFGATAPAEVARKAKMLDISLDAAQKMAEDNPRLFLSVFGRKEKEPFVNPLTPGINTAGNSGTPKKGKKYFDEILRTKGQKEYFKPEVQLEMMKAIKEFPSFEEFEKN